MNGKKRAQLGGLRLFDTSGLSRKALTIMYDPARDIFTSSEDPPMDPDDESAERSNTTVVQDQQAEGMPSTRHNLNGQEEPISRVRFTVRFPVYCP